MKRTSPSSRLVRMAARSPDRSRAGPLVTRKPTSISAATIPAIEVLPRPGGPARRMWSTAWARCLAAPSMMSRCSRSAGWPTNSARRRGRSVVSSFSSSGSAVTPARSSSSRTSRSVAVEGGARRPVDGQELERLLQQHLDGPVEGQGAEHAADLLGAVAEPLEGGPDLGPAARPAVDPGRVGGSGTELGRQLDHEPLGGALPDPGDEGEGVEIAL